MSCPICASEATHRVYVDPETGGAGIMRPHAVKTPMLPLTDLLCRPCARAATEPAIEAWERVERKRAIADHVVNYVYVHYGA